ncbi:hypothetical protein NKI86_21715, partial [Mesorhizobium sp. M0320]|uniref:hypothetical protein n=1 Tax=Mesorhizobium sp. M0320 TaxID=2956936 RepID=UPI00333784E6
STWTTCASTRSSLCAKPHDQHHGCPILQNLTHTTHEQAGLAVSGMLNATARTLKASRLVRISTTRTQLAQGLAIGQPS